MQLTSEIAEVKRRCRKAGYIVESSTEKESFGLLPKNPLVLKVFKWSDNKVYEWEIINSKPSFINGVASAFLFWISITAIVFIPLSVIELISPWLSLVVLLFFSIIFVLAMYENRTKFKKNKILQSNLFIKMNKDKKIMSLLPQAFLTGCFLYVLSSPIIPIRDFFENYSDSKISWVLLSVQNIIDAIFLDITEVFNVDFVEMKANTFVGRIILMSLNLLIIYSVVSMILSAYKSQKEEKSIFYGTVKECYFFLLEDLKFDKDKLVCKGKYEALAEPKTVLIQDFFTGLYEEFNAEIFKQKQSSKNEKIADPQT